MDESRLELETKVRTKVRNHGESERATTRAFSRLKAPTLRHYQDTMLNIDPMVRKSERAAITRPSL